MSNRATPASRAEFKYFTEVTTRWGDQDPYGHVNNVVYYSYCEAAISEFLVARGTLDITGSPVIGLIVNSGCTYFSPIEFPGRIAVGVRISHLGNSSARYEVALFRGDDVHASAVAHIVYVYVERSSNVSVPIPAAVRAELHSLTDDARLGTAAQAEPANIN
ncbi:thioesterase [Pseudomonas alkylphenolica]|uniref:Thioesterase n=1 Tax=Pseudomonas alkylphenolica TaxID=237609 RepID=A0A443ZTT8_9PSED|nr:thioesterase family protein [Pseudomonas alkylphenolica]RWU23029.1 thioesterase [Pseudomonas alkylphenolica]